MLIIFPHQQTYILDECN